MEKYIDFPVDDGSFVSLESFENSYEIPNQAETNLIPEHKHRHYEMVLVLRGGCRHIYQGKSTPLITGDFFLIPPHRAHGYQLQDNFSMCNCQFYPDKIWDNWYEMLHDIRYDVLQNGSAGGEEHFGADINRQGIIHLSTEENIQIGGLLSDILKEQTVRSHNYKRMKQMLLEMILINIKRVQIRQFSNLNKHASWKKDMINAAQQEIEENLTVNFDFKGFAERQNITLGYFRTIFKDITGLTPVEYVNRLKVLHALKDLQSSNISVIDAAAKVGIYDANYFSRLFRQIIGYSPSQCRR